MQSLVKKKDSDKPAPTSASSAASSAAAASNKPKTKPTMLSTAEKIYHEAGVKGFFRGVTPRVGLSAYRVRSIPLPFLPCLLSRGGTDQT